MKQVISLWPIAGRFYYMVVTKKASVAFETMQEARTWMRLHPAQ